MSVRKQRNGSIAEDTKQKWNLITPSWIAASCLSTRMQATNNLLPLFADVSLQLIPTDVNSSISLASSQNSSDFKTRSSFSSAPHPVADIAAAPHFIDIVPFVTWLVCRKRTAVLDPKRTVLNTFKSELLLTTVCVDMSYSNCSLVSLQCFSACCLCKDVRNVVRGFDLLY